MNRRKFLSHGMKLGAIAAGSSLLNGRLAQALATSGAAVKIPADRFLVQLTMFFGWDTSLGLDPWTAPQRPAESDYFIEYRPSELIPFGDNFLGPAMKSLKSHVQDFVVANGVFMNDTDNGHPANQNFIATGNGQYKDAYLCVAYEASKVRELPFGVLTSGNVFEGRLAIQTTDAQSSLNVDPSSFVEATGRKLTPLQRLSKAFMSDTKKITAAQAELNNLKIAPSDTNSQIAASVAMCFKHGLSRTAYADLQGQNDTGLDTHSDHPVNHLKAQMARWDIFEKWIRVFKTTEYKNGESLYSHTTFVVMSDFTRTPALNAARGKDHNPYSNSVLFAGAGVNGPHVVGESRLVVRKESSIGVPYVVGLPIDIYGSGKPIQNFGDAQYAGLIVTPEVIAATTAAILGVDRKIFANGYGAPVLPGVAKV